MRITRSALVSAALGATALGSVAASPVTASAQSVRTAQISGTTSTGGGVGTTSTGSGVAGVPSAGASDATQLRATQGSSTIDSTNVDALARSGTVGTTAVDTLGTSSDPLDSNYSARFSPVQSAAPSLPSPKVGIDLEAIRQGLAAAPSATPDAAGN